MSSTKQTRYKFQLLNSLRKYLKTSSIYFLAQIINLPSRTYKIPQDQ
jgi:hypothetical protein